MSLKVNYSAIPTGGLVVVPLFTDKDGKLQTELLPKGVQESVGADLESLKDGGKKKYFVDGLEYFVITCGNIKEARESIRGFVTSMIQVAKSDFAKEICLDYRGLPFEMSAEGLVDLTLDTFYTATYGYHKFKKKPSFQIEKLTIVSELNFAKAGNWESAVDKRMKYVNLTRDLVNAPANVLTIDEFENVAKEHAKSNKLTMKVYDEKKLKEMGMNLILAVGQGSVQRPRLLEISYKYDDALPKNFIVGKGVVFDTGGLNLKPGDSMLGMKEDMAGSATALAVINALADMQAKCNLTVLIPLVENAIGSGAIHPGDVVTGYKGKSVEINNTDAEGRLIMADALAYADEQGADLIIDIATLTGAALVALGSKITAGFFTDDGVRDGMFASAKNNGELIWQLPLVDEYREGIKSKIADLSNISTPPREAGTITAALFLQEFVEKAKWVHLDIAGPAFFSSAWKQYPEGATGIMVKTLVDYFSKV